MAWGEQLPIMVRYMIGDVEDPYTYNDQRLQMSILIAAKYVDNELNFSQAFEIDIIGMTISPDPTVSPTIDDWFSNLSVLRACLMITTAEMKAMTANALYFKEGSTTVDMREQLKYKQEMLKQFKQDYDHAKLSYQLAVRPSCNAIIGPFNIMAGNFRGPVYPYTQRDRIFT